MALYIALQQIAFSGMLQEGCCRDAHYECRVYRLVTVDVEEMLKPQQRS